MWPAPWVPVSLACTEQWPSRLEPGSAPGTLGQPCPEPGSPRVLGKRGRAGSRGLSWVWASELQPGGRSAWMGAGSFHARPQDTQGGAERPVGGGGPPWGWAQLQDPVLWWSGPAASGQWAPWPLPARGSPSRGWWPVTGHNTVVGAAGPRLTPGASGAPGLWGSGCGGTASGPACGHLRPSALAWSWVEVPAAGSSPHRPFLWPCAPLPSLWPGSGHTWQHGPNRSAPVGVGWAGRLLAWAPLPFSALSPARS